MFIYKIILTDSPLTHRNRFGLLAFLPLLIKTTHPPFPSEIWPGNSVPLRLPTLQYRIIIPSFSQLGTAFLYSHLFILTNRGSIMVKVLLVEDDKTIVANLTEYLNGAGYIVRSVSGQSAAMAT